MREMLSRFFEWAPGDTRGSTQYSTLGALKEAVSQAGLGVTAAELAIDNIQPTDAATTSTGHASVSATKLGTKRKADESMGSREQRSKKLRLTKYSSL